MGENGDLSSFIGDYIGRVGNKVRGAEVSLHHVGSSTSSYLLVMTVWDRQDGANAALKSHTEQQRFRFYFTPSLLSSGGYYELT